ncbi:MAG: BrnT family toxin [Xanthobacteraceae bacterium]
MNEDVVYDFEWDPAKALYNARKHGVTFDQAATVLLDALALTVYDDANSQHEERWFTLGLDAGGNLLAVAHAYEIIGPTNVRIRIISARKATKRERRSYEDEPR